MTTRTARSGVRAGCRIAVALALATTLLAGCGEVETESATPSGAKPAKLGSPDPAGIRDVTLTEKAAERIGLELETVEAENGHREVPDEALIIDGSGKPWVYTVISEDELTFRRVAIKIAAHDDDAVLLSAGPAVGTSVVAQGATQVYGAELEMEGKH